MDNFIKEYKKLNKPIYQKNNKAKLTKEFLKANVEAIKKGQLKKIYRENNTKRLYGYNPIIEKPVLLKVNKKGDLVYKYQKELFYNKKKGIIYKKKDYIYEELGDYGSMRRAYREAFLNADRSFDTLIIYQDGDIIFEGKIEYSSGWYKENSKMFFQDRYDNPTPIWNFDELVKFVFTKYDDLKPNQIRQLYSEGISNCFLTPIKNDFETKYKNTESKSMKKKLETNILYLEELKEYYPDGLPLEEIEKISNDLKISITISSPFINEPYYENKPLNAKYRYNFLNTKLNHVEHDEKSIFNNFFNSSNVIELSNKDMELKYNELNRSQEPFIYKKNIYNEKSQIQTLDTIYKCKGGFFEEYNKFLIDTDLINCKIDMLKNIELQSFINNGVHYSSTVDFKDVKNLKTNEVEHIDQKKAYFNYFKNDYYEGLLTCITDFREVNNYNKIGYYILEDLDLSNTEKKFQELNNKLLLFKNNTVYPDSILRFLEDNNASFNVKYGAYGISEDIRFPKEFLEKDEKGISGYCKAVGYMSKTDLYSNSYFNTTKEHAEFIRNQTDNIYYDSRENKAVFRLEKNKVLNLKHIVGQITAFQQIGMFQQLLKMDYDKLIRICVDGIYYYKHNYINRDKILNNQDNIFQHKTDIKFGNYPDEVYIHVDNNNLFIPSNNKQKDYYKTELHKGAGGTGKSHINLIDKGFINPVYVAPSYKLLAEKSKYNIDVVVLYKLLNEPYISNGYLSKWNVYFIDECSMITEKQKQFLIKNIKGRIIFIGDVGYQLPPIKLNEEDKEMNESGIHNIIEYKKTYRFKDDKIKSVCKKLRQLIKCKSNKKVEDMDFSIFQKITKEELKKIYQKEDMILISENNIGANYDLYFKDIKKYKIKTNTNEYQNGQIIFEDIDIKKELRHAFTVHSVQGETFKHKIFIDLKKFKSLKMLYTAISRAEYFNQIYIIE